MPLEATNKNVRGGGAKLAPPLPGRVNIVSLELETLGFQFTCHKIQIGSQKKKLTPLLLTWMK